VLRPVNCEEFEFEENEVSVSIGLALEEFDLVVGSFEWLRFYDRTRQGFRDDGFGVF
jgi:hypothetical protein